MTSRPGASAASPAWGPPAHPPLRPWERGGVLRDLATGAALLAVWIALWSVFTLGVAAPAGRLGLGADGTGAWGRAPALPAAAGGDRDRRSRAGESGSDPRCAFYGGDPRVASWESSAASMKSG
jgi:hypothetical protein